LLAGSEFSGTIDAAPADVGDLLRAPTGSTSDVPDDEKLTVFAPIDSAFDDNDFAQESAVKAEVGSPQSVVLFMGILLSVIRLCDLSYYFALHDITYVQYIRTAYIQAA